MNQAIWHYRLSELMLKHLPYGRVTSYGQLARLAGMGRQARWVGRWMGLNSRELALPWFRVLRSGGQLPFSHESAEGQDFIHHLQEENIVVHKNHVDWQIYAWLPNIVDEEGWLMWAEHSGLYSLEKPINPENDPLTKTSHKLKPHN
ncbi:MGMT family protein [Pokkaliibacter sp. MBI-7]|uniref:MGMT family protein n=1 Tax=Pokkaliibacter sp. MBI-7 TaxID=3040600 RepID=UPI002447B323|nr:MGMT family protein [Pokkaliibacter sp. MBI-7]MDH2432842.1 MGMT family protein [Pokkaliibacter sp. MBI-7]